MCSGWQHLGHPHFMQIDLTLAPNRDDFTRPRLYNRMVAIAASCAHEDLPNFPPPLWHSSSLGER